MKKKFLLTALWVLSIIVEVAIAFVPILCKSTLVEYLYPEYTESRLVGQIIGLAALILLCNALLVVAYRLFKKGVRVASIILAIISIHTLLILCLMVSIGRADRVVESRTTEVDNFGVFDDYVKLDFDRLTAEQLTDFTRDEIKDYYYLYDMVLDDYEYNIAYTVELTDERFGEVYALLKSEPAFSINEDDGVSVFTVIDTDESYLNAALWEDTVIKVYHEDNRIEFYFSYRWPIYD